jgi:hypothetical protein
VNRGALTCRLVHDFTETVSLAGQWDELLKRGSFDCVFASYGFMRAWWRVYGWKRVLWLAVVEDAAKEVRLIAPLYHDPDFQRLTIISGQGSDYSQLILSRDDRESMDCLFRFLRKRKDWQVFSTSCVPDSPLMHYFEWRAPGALARLLPLPALVRMPASWESGGRCTPTLTGKN